MLRGLTCTLPPLTAEAFTVAGCGGPPQDSAGSAPHTQTSPAPSSTVAQGNRGGSPRTDKGGEAAAEQGQGEAVVVEGVIHDGHVASSGERIGVKIGQTVRFVVDSDAADEIPVHSTPEHSFAFKAGVDHKRFQFTLQPPGVVGAELHELGDFLAIAARP